VFQGPRYCKLATGSPGKLRSTNLLKQNDSPELWLKWLPTANQQVKLCRFTESYAKRLDALLPLNVKEAQPGEAIREGYIYIAPGGRHLEVRKRAFGFETVVQDNEPVNLHRPSVQVLFDSVAKQGVGRAIAIILTGMGKDGSQALARIRAAGMRTFAQDEASSVVWGMPGAAVKEFNAVAEKDVLDLPALADRVSELGH